MKCTSFDVFKLTRVALERNALRRAEFSARIGQYNPEQLVFCDESAVDRRTTYRGYGWSVKGQPATRHAFFCRGRRCECALYHCYHLNELLPIIRFSVLPALSLRDGILHCDVVEGSFNSQLFYDFISRLLDCMQPWPAPNSVIVMDNCRIHKHPAIVQLIQER